MSEFGSQTFTVASPPLLSNVHGDLSALAHESELHDFSEMRDRVQERIRDLANPLLIMVVGEGKFGKSTLINALSGKVIAPVSRVPKTWKVDLYEAVSGSENALLSWRSRPDAPEAVAIEQAQTICAELESKAKEAQVQEVSWKSDLYQVHWRLNAPWPPAGVALVDTPGFSQLRADSSVSNTFLYGSKGIVFEASDAFKYYFYRADVVLWCIRSDRLEDYDTREMLKASGKRDDIVGIITYMDTIPSERWQEVEDKAREKFGDYITKFMFSAAGPKGRVDLVNQIRSYLESQYIADKDNTKSNAITGFLASEREQFSGDVESVMALYKENFKTRFALVRSGEADMDRIWRSAQRTLDDVAERYYNRAIAKLSSLWDQADGSIEQFEWHVRNAAAEPRLLCEELSQAYVSASDQAVNAANLILVNAEWVGIRLNAEASPRPFSCQVLSQITNSTRTSVAGLQTTFTGGEGIGTGLTVGALGAGIGAIALGPFGLAAGLIGVLVGAITKRGRCISKAKDALKSCYEENAQRQLKALRESLTLTFDGLLKALDDSLAEHHGKDIAGVMEHAVLADNSCMALNLDNSKQRSHGPACFHRSNEAFESIYTASLCTVVPEIAASWDAGCLWEWGDAISSSFLHQWQRALSKFESLASREAAIDFYAEKLKDAAISELENKHEVLLEPSRLLHECSIGQDLRGTIPSFSQVLNDCNCDRLHSLESFTETHYEAALSAEYYRRIDQAFADGIPYLGSRLVKSFRPGCLVTIAILLGLIGMANGWMVLLTIGGVGIGATMLGALLSKRNAKREAMRYAEEVVGTFYQKVFSEIEASGRDKFQPKLETK